MWRSKHDFQSPHILSAFFVFCSVNGELFHELILEKLNTNYTFEARSIIQLLTTYF